MRPTSRDRRNAYLCSKKNAKQIWISVDRIRKKFIDFIIGRRDTKTGLKLWERTNNKSIETVYTDYYSPYEQIIPAEKHIQTKAETYTVEGYNSLFRHFLARMRRRTKCYSKCIKMLEHSIKLLMAKRNNVLYT